MDGQIEVRGNVSEMEEKSLRWSYRQDGQRWSYVVRSGWTDRGGLSSHTGVAEMGI